MNWKTTFVTLCGKIFPSHLQKAKVLLSLCLHLVRLVPIHQHTLFACKETSENRTDKYSHRAGKYSVKFSTFDLEPLTSDTAVQSFHETLLATRMCHQNYI